MTATTLRVLCANCAGDELLSRLVAGTTACPWCGLSFDDDFAPAGESRPILLSVVLMEDESTGSSTGDQYCSPLPKKPAGQPSCTKGTSAS